ncbi:MAG: alpha-L-fucosidase [Armatimonadetes bacterium]|nr:alpha-L-fucosidase [Armatimonadota bacterium]
MSQRLWYREPASDWTEGLPIGDGRLAAMVIGSCPRERLALNHEWLWEGKWRFRDLQNVAQHLPEVREVLLSGDYERGTELANRCFGGGGIGPLPTRVDSFQTAGDLFVEFSQGPWHDYTRELDLTTGIATVTYGAVRRDGAKYKREVLAHLTEHVILVRLTAGGRPLSCVLWLDRVHDPNCALVREATESALRMRGDIRDGISFEVQARVLVIDGAASVLEGCKVAVTDATEVLVAVDIGTSAQGQPPEDECAAHRLTTTDWDALVASHIAEHERHYGGLTLELPFDEPDLPTDRRLQDLRAGGSDPALALLYFNYGRYLLCASSATATLPATLQGRWCEELHPCWNSDLHQDVNIQMCYWGAEPGGLQAYLEALLRHIERQVPHGREAARKLYGCEGVWLPIQTDPWGRCTPESDGWAVWIGAAPWLAQHLWWHYEFSLDEDFLRDRAYPFLKEVAAFYESYLIEDEAGNLLIVPSQSPENRFVGSGPRYPVSIGINATMDVQLAHDTLTHAATAAEFFGLDADRAARWRDLCARLPCMQVGSKGQLLEWNREFEEVEPGHRHISHLYGFYPGDLICPCRTPELFAAAQRSLELRLEAMGGHTGWSRAWTACCFARAGRGDEALYHVEHLVTDFATDTLLDLHPPRIFQIDGNLGGFAAVIEMLLQSYHEELHLLPALPAAWPQGQVRGLRARGGFSVDIAWEAGAVVEAALHATRTRPCRVWDASAQLAPYNADGTPLEARRDGQFLVYQAQAGTTAYVRQAAPESR